MTIPSVLFKICGVLRSTMRVKQADGHILNKSLPTPVYSIITNANNIALTYMEKLPLLLQDMSQILPSEKVAKIWDMHPHPKT